MEVAVLLENLESQLVRDFTMKSAIAESQQLRWKNKSPDWRWEVIQTLDMKS